MPFWKANALPAIAPRKEKIKGDLDLSTRKGILFGGETSEKVLVPGHPEQSLLMTAIQWKDEDYEMPPKENDRLSEEQIGWMREWIRLGAPWPDQATRKRYLLEERAKPVTEDGILVKTSGGLSDEWTYRRYKPEDMWAFQSLEQPEVPIPGLNPIDSFVRRSSTRKRSSPVRPLISVIWSNAPTMTFTDSLRLLTKSTNFALPGTKILKKHGST